MDTAGLIVDPFTIRYDGGDTDGHIINAELLGESLAGGAKFYTAIAHYVALGVVPKRKYRREFGCYATPATAGSWEQLVFVAPLAGQTALHAFVYRAAINYTFGRIVKAVKG